jgi:hypothetical protein
VPLKISSAENSASADIRARAIRADGPALHGVQRLIVDAAREGSADSPRKSAAAA